MTRLIHFWCYCFQIFIITVQRLAPAVVTHCSNIRHEVKGNKIVACHVLESIADVLPCAKESNEIASLLIYLVCEFLQLSLLVGYQGLYEHARKEESNGNEGRAEHCRACKCTCSPPSWVIFEPFLCLHCTVTLLLNSFILPTSVTPQLSGETHSCLALPDIKLSWH